MQIIDDLMDAALYRVLDAILAEAETLLASGRAGDRAAIETGLIAIRLDEAMLSCQPAHYGEACVYICARLRSILDAPQ